MPITDQVLADHDPLDMSLALGKPKAPAAAIEPVASPVPAGLSPAAPLDIREQFYASLDPGQADKLRKNAARIKETMKDAILDIGHALIEINDNMPGHFDKWLKLEFGMSKATAYNYMNTVKRFGGTPKVVKVLPRATVYRLGAKSTPDDVRDAVVREIEAGAPVSVADVERRIAASKDVAKQEKQAKANLVEAERLKEVEKQKWQEKARTLALAGKNDGEIAKERAVWDSEMERKARAEQGREDKQRKLIEELQAKQKASEEEAAKLVTLLRDNLPTIVLDEFRRRMTKLNSDAAQHFAAALSKELPANFGRF